MLSREDILLLGAGATTIITIVAMALAIVYAPAAAAPVAVIGLTVASTLAYDALKHFFNTLLGKVYKEADKSAPKGASPSPPVKPPSPPSGIEMHKTHTMLFKRHESGVSDGGIHVISDTEESLVFDEILRPKRPINY